MASLLGAAGGREYVLKIVADVTDAIKGVDQVAASTTSFKDKAVGIGKGVAAGLATAAVAEFGRQVVQSGMAADEAMDAVASVFGDASNQVISFSQTVADKMGLSATEYNMMAAKSGQAMTQMGISQQEAATRTETMAQRAADLSAIFGGDATEAMNAFDKAMIGQTKGLKKYNIVIEKSEVEARALAEGYVDVNGEVTDAGKAIAAQELILEKTSKQAGAYAENSGDLAAQQERLAAKFDNVKATIAEQLLPVIEKLVSTFEPFINFIAQNAGTLTMLAAGIGAVVLAVKAWQMAQLLWNTATTVATGIQWAFNAAMMANPIGLIIAAVAALVAGFVLLYTKVDWFREAVDAAVQAVWSALQWLWDWISNNWPLLLAILTGPFGLAVAAIVKYWDEIKAAVLAVFNWIKDNWPLLLAILTGPFGLAVLAITKNWETIKDFFRNLPGLIQGWLSGLFDIIKYPFSRAFDWIKERGEGIYDFFRRIPERINQAFSNLYNIIKYPFEQAFNAIKNLWNNTVGKLSFTVPSWVPGIGGKGWSAPRLAAGGIVTRPTIALIGEAGPEAVIPLNRMGATASASAPTYVINVYALNPTPEVGRLVYTAIRDYERTSGTSVLNSPAIPSGF